jgi:hypothetical protein
LQLQSYDSGREALLKIISPKIKNGLIYKDIKQFLHICSYDSGRINLFKILYPFIQDHVQNFVPLLNSFTYDSGKQELAQFISNCDDSEINPEEFASQLKMIFPDRNKFVKCASLFLSQGIIDEVFPQTEEEKRILEEFDNQIEIEIKGKISSDLFSKLINMFPSGEFSQSFVMNNNDIKITLNKIQ